MVHQKWDYVRIVKEMLRKSIRAEGKFLIFILATFYLEISTFITRNFELKSRNFEI